MPPGPAPAPNPGTSTSTNTSTNIRTSGPSPGDLLRVISIGPCPLHSKKPHGSCPNRKGKLAAPVCARLLNKNARAPALTSNLRIRTTTLCVQEQDRIAV
ncbi:hypothetical protein IAQ61_000117 [Plenodomus lingam]|uniref:uncharacterized protein n=1 Tax=Leptosphaeria maculans TaxID=5022 RepID=UPI003331AD2A|nr:hypothetical protein IAQ61_000117 [Plenodomus lingam]